MRENIRIKFKSLQIPLSKYTIFKRRQTPDLPLCVCVCLGAGGGGTCLAEWSWRLDRPEQEEFRSARGLQLVPCRSLLAPLLLRCVAIQFPLWVIFWKPEQLQGGCQVVYLSTWSRA